MKRSLLVGLFVLAYSFTVNAQNVYTVMWTDSFRNGTAPNAQEIANWNAFRASLTSNLCYDSMRITGTFDQAGQVCRNATITAAFANALNTGSTYISPSTNGNVWHLCWRYDGEVWLNPPSSCSGSNCPSGYIIRPGIANINWGGVNTATCGPPNQRQSFIFYCHGATFNMPTDTALCFGESLTLAGNGNGQSYTWSNGVTDGVPFTVDSSRTYTVTGVDSGGCPAWDSVIVNVNPLPAVGIASSADTVCVQSGPIVITGTPSGGTYSGTAVTSGQFAPNTAGTGDHWVMYTYTDTNGCMNTDSAQIHVAPCVGIEEIAAYTWSVQPNPFNDQIQIVTSSRGIDGNEEFVLRNALGAIIRRDVLTSTRNTLDLSDLSPGVYIYQVRSSGGKVRDIGKLIKQ